MYTVPESTVPESTVPDAHVPSKPVALARTDSGFESTTTSTDSDAPAEPEHMHLDAAPDTRQDIIEQIFQRVEEETARRAEEEEYRSRPGTASTQPSISATSPAPVGSVSAATMAAVRERRRGSISVSRFGQIADLASGTHENPSALPSRQNSVIIKASNSGAFYKAQKYAGSEDSFASASEFTPLGDTHDEEQVTQMETIAGRVSLGKAMGRTIARRLSRARTRSRDVLTVVPGAGIGAGLVIGVSVEEATVEAEHDPDAEEALLPPGTPQSTAFVYAQAEATNSRGGSRSRRSTISMPMANAPIAASQAVSNTGNGSPETTRLSAATSSFVAKAKDLTRIFRRRSMAVLPPNSAP